MMEQHQDSPALIEKAETSTEVTFETKLTQEIAHLWSIHSQAQTVLGRTKEDLRRLRLELGRRLYEMKVLLACPGRGGQWSKFLSGQGIPRASADRYAKSYVIALNPPAVIASSEAISESADETARKVLQSVWPKLREVLTNPETAYQFLCAVLERCDTLQAEITDSGITIRKPATVNSESSSISLESQNFLTEASITEGQ